MMRTIFVSLAFLLTTISAIGQQADRIQRGQRGYTPPPRFSTDAYIDTKDVQEELAIILPKCEEKFGLDAFQTEILKNILTKKFEGENAILTDDKNTRETRKAKIVALNNELFKDLGTILTPEQVTEFKNLDFTEATQEEKKKEKKRRRKNRKNKS